MSILRTAGRAAVASSVHGRVQRRQQAKWSHQDDLAAQTAAQQAAQQAALAQQAAAQQAAAQVAPAPVAAAPAGTDMATKLEKLAQLDQLRASGTLSDNEFEVLKTEVLRS
ncbi:MAG: SHOCT domain-containing protein [Candidatus Nanopelagicales bacterium]